MADIDFAYATTARGRELTKPVLTPATAMADGRARVAAGERIAIIYGPERAGLENDDVARANAIITVPVNPDFPSLNLGAGGAAERLRMGAPRRCRSSPPCMAAVPMARSPPPASRSRSWPITGRSG